MSSLEVPDCHCTHSLLLDLLFFEVLQYITSTLKKGISTRYLPVESIGWGGDSDSDLERTWGRHGAAMNPGLGRHGTDMGRQ